MTSFKFIVSSEFHLLKTYYPIPTARNTSCKFSIHAQVDGSPSRKEMRNTFSKLFHRGPRIAELIHEPPPRHVCVVLAPLSYNHVELLNLAKMISKINGRVIALNFNDDDDEGMFVIL